MLLKKLFQKRKFPGSADYWEDRYARGRNSGQGSFGNLAEFKAQILNDFVRKYQIENVIEYGCGDGNQLTLAIYPSYVGFDVSPTVIKKCQNIFALDSSKKFELISNYNGKKAELTLSLDVIYHLVEDRVFSEYMDRVFSSSDKYVIIYSNDIEDCGSPNKSHVRSRKFSQWVLDNAKSWKLKEVIKNKFPKESTADFFIYEKR